MSQARMGTRIVLVDDAGIRPDRQSTKSGNAPGAYGAEIVFADFSTEIEVRIWDKPVIIRLVSWGGHVNDEFELPEDSFWSTNFRVRGFQIKNKVALDVARFQIIGSYCD